jgi:hypothetical protein
VPRYFDVHIRTFTTQGNAPAVANARHKPYIFVLRKHTAITRAARAGNQEVNFAHRACAWDLTEGRFDYLLVGSTGVSEPLPATETRLGRRTALTFPLLPPPQKN